VAADNGFGGGFNANFANASFVDCLSKGNAGSGFVLTNGAATNCVADSNGQGFFIDNQVRLTACSAQHSENRGFVVSGFQCVLIDCRAADNSVGIDVIAGVLEGGTVSPYYDNLIAQVIAWGEDRAQAIERLLAFLGEVTIEGVGTNIPLIRRVLADDEFARGDHDTGYLPRLFERLDIDALIDEGDREAGKGDAKIDRSSLEIEGTDELKVVASSQVS